MITADRPCCESPPPRRFGGLRDVISEPPLRLENPSGPPEVRAAGVARLGDKPSRSHGGYRGDNPLTPQPKPTSPPAYVASPPRLGVPECEASPSRPGVCSLTATPNRKGHPPGTIGPVTSAHSSFVGAGLSPTPTAADSKDVLSNGTSPAGCMSLRGEVKESKRIHPWEDASTVTAGLDAAQSDEVTRMPPKSQGQRMWWNSS
jgi:hypothetical protein